MNWSSAVALAVVLVIGTTAAAQQQPTRARQGLLLNGVWEFAVAPDGEPPREGWQRMRVPHRSREFEDDPPASAWYRTTFRVPEQWQREVGELVLDLSRLRHYARLYVDGEPVGEHWGMRTPFVVDLTERLEPGQTYPLLIYVHNCTGKYAHPSGRELSEKAERALRTVFWHSSASTVGVEGDIWLRRRPRVRIEDVYVVPSVRESRLRASLKVRNAGPAEARVAVRMQVHRRGQVQLDLAQ
jgi:beta-galactosidase/beta-glucuronidase